VVDPAPRLDELRVLVDVAEAGSVAAAARHLGVPKSTIGRAVRRLETEMGVVLLRRRAGAGALTDAGRALVLRAAPHVTALRDATRALARQEGEVHGVLRITSPADLAEHVLGPLVVSFTSMHPAVRVEVDATLRVVDLVGEGYDLALRVARHRLPSSSLVATKLARLDLGLYASPAYLARCGRPQRPEDLASHDAMLLMSRGGRMELVLDGPHRQERVTVRGRISANDFSFLRQALLSGSGIGLLPWFRAADDVAQGRLVRILPEHRLAGTNAFVVHPALRPLPARTRAFKEFVLAHARRLVLEPKP
jgi:DNA-binding transcriptional LysR family regulator